MIRSMTGYGSAKGTSGKLEITIELRSVNNRFLDCSVRIPRVYTALEDGIKSQIQKNVSRGKVDVFVTIDSSKADDISISVNESVADAYMNALKEISMKYGIPNDATSITLSKFQDVLFVTKKEADVEQLGKDISDILQNAIEDFNSMRLREGEKLKNDVLGKAGEVEALVRICEERSPQTISEYRERLYKKMTEILESTSIDEARILTEAAIFADKVTVDEETVRLRSHVEQLRNLMESDEPVGRKLDFLIQEFNREANTIGSKCNDIEMSHTVVELKSVIEKIREQVQNIE